MKRTLLLMATNFAVVAMLGIVWNVLDSMFGVSEALRQMGMPAEFGYIALMSLVMGFAGAFMSLWMSNGDMVTQTLLQGVMNTFVFFFSRVIATLVNSLMSRGEGNRGNSYGMVYYKIVLLRWKGSSKNRNHFRNNKGRCCGLYCF